MSATALLLALGAVVLLIIVTLVLRTIRAENRLAARVALIRRAADVNEVQVQRADDLDALLRPVARLGELIARSGLLSAKTLAELEGTLRVSGLHGRRGLSVFVGAKLLLLVGLPLGLFLLMGQLGWSPDYKMPLLGGAGIVGLLAPDKIINGRRKAHLKALDQGLPDALDLMVICSQAGLGLEPAIERVGREIQVAHPVVAAEFQTVAHDLRLNVDRAAVLLALVERTGLENIRRFATTLIQTMQYGTPLSDALRLLSTEMRQEMLTRFESRAAKLPVLLTLPMIVFILPCVFLVVGGPAMIQVMKSFSK